MGLLLEKNHPMPSSEGAAYRPDIDGLRAIAVLAVLGFHGEIGLTRGGFLGVDIFFVISGYLISGIIWRALDKGSFSFSNFYTRRINRIFPSLLVVLAATALLGWPILYPGEFANLGKHLLGGSTFVSNFILWNEAGYFASPDKPLLHLWSLAIEEQFYLLWPVVLVGMRWRGWRPGWALSLIIAASFLANVLLIRSSNGTAAFYSPIARFWELLAGGLLCHYEKQRVADPRSPDKNPLVGQLLSIIGAALLIVGLASVDRNTPWPGWWAALPVAAAVLLIAAGPNAWINRNVLGNKLMVAIGLISYPLYLWHLPLMVYTRILYQAQAPKPVRVGLMALSVVLATLTYVYVEKPIRFGVNKRRSAARLIPALALLAVIGLALQTRIVRARLDGAYSARVESASRDEAPGGVFTGSGNDILVYDIPGDTSQAVAVIGDSHAGQYFPRFEKMASVSPQMPRTLFMTYGGCPPIPSVNHVGISWDGAPFRCDKFHDIAMRKALEAHVKVLVYSAYWETYLDQHSLFLSSDSDRQPITGRGSRTDSLFALLEGEVRQLTDSGIKVYIVLSNPASPSYNPLSMMPGRLPGLKSKSFVGSVGRSAMAASREPTATWLRALARRTGAEVIDPLEYLCGPESCPTVSTDGSPLYRDDHHLRATYARDHATYMDQVLSH